jgi:hypothetical protein
MDITENIQKNKNYKKQIDQMSKKSLKLIAKDEFKALEAAAKGIKQIEPDKINDAEYVQYVANLLQKLAQKAIEERSKK